MNKKWNAIRPSRRAVLAGIGASVAAPAILRHSRAYAANPVIKVGHVSPRTGPLAGFAEADDYVLSGVADIFKAGLANNGKTYTVEVISKDSQSNPNRAAEVAADLILGEKVDIIVAAATPAGTQLFSVARENSISVPPKPRRLK